VPFLFGIVGRSDVGKTTLILKLVPELIKRGYRVGVVKNCPHGFDLDREGKDSWKFYQKGAEGVFLASPQRFAFVERIKEEREEDILKYFSLLFYNFDVVLVEGFSNLREIKKIELLREGISQKINPSLEKVIAVVSDFEINTDKPVFNPQEIGKIVDFMEKVMEKITDKVEVIVNGEKLPLNFFLKKMVRNLALAVVDPLKRKDEKEEIKEVIIKVSREDR